jgi:AcrR family transcriptional regulator
MVRSISRSTPRQQKREETFERIIDSALEALASGGIDSLTMQRLATTLGFAVGALYRYFPSKDSLLVAVQRRIVETLHSEVVAALAQVDATLSGAPGNRSRTSLVRLWVAASVYDSMSKARPTEFGLVSMLLGDPRHLVNDDDASQMVPSLVRLLQVVGSLFAAASDAHALTDGDPLRRTLVLWTSMQGALQLRKLERFAPGGPGASVFLEETVSTLLVGWGATPREVTAARQRAHALLNH